MEFCAWPGRFMSIARELIQVGGWNHIPALTHHGRASQRGYLPGALNIIVQILSIRRVTARTKAWICSLRASTVHRSCNARTYAQQCSYFETRGRYVLDEALKHQEEGMPITNSKPACYWLEGLSGPCKHQKGVLLGSRTKMPPISVCRRVAATRKPLNDDIEVIEPACLWSIIIVNQYTRISKMSDQKEKSVTGNKNQWKKKISVTENGYFF